MVKKGQTNKLCEIMISLISVICLIGSIILISANMLKIPIYDLSSFTLNLLGLVLFFVGGVGAIFYLNLCDKKRLFE